MEATFDRSPEQNPKMGCLSFSFGVAGVVVVVVALGIYYSDLFLSFFLQFDIDSFKAVNYCFFFVI